MTAVELEGVTVRKGDEEILSGIDLAVESGRVLAVVGASGSGKTTVVRAIAGLDEVVRGRVRFDGVDVTHVDTGDRDVAMVFQRPTLYPHRSIRRNISFPLEVRRQHADEIRRRVGAEARVLHIEELLERKPSQLSAGETQIVQVARAMVRKPAVLLLDEPFSGLDADRAAELRREVALIQRGFGVTTVLATNDSYDAMAMTDRVAVIERGRITQVGEPLAVYDDPQTAAAALFTGEADVIEVRVGVDADGAWLVHPGFRIRAWQPALRRHAERRLQLVVRPEWWQIDEHGPVRARVERVQRLGARSSLWCRVGGQPVTVAMAGHAEHAAGDEVSLRLDRSVLVDPLDGRRLRLD